VYTLFGDVALVLDKPGLHFLWPKLTYKAFLIRALGRIYVLNLSLDQRYLRSNPVNSEEGAPMGIGIWYEMFIGDPLNFLFKNTDPRGSLAANVSNATVRTLSNLPLSTMLSDRHTLSQTVRTEVTQKSHEWGYELGSVYLRKVHFRDHQMIKEIESKVVNRLRQVTASIRQDGENQVHIITNGANRTASFEFGRASAIRPQIVGNALQEIGSDPEVASAMFEILETQKLLESKAELILIPNGDKLVTDLITSQ
jgi:regulator of protease activity HflC (stomatin/prohibitin superfamily)